MTYLKWLKLLLQAREKLQPLLAEIQKIMDAVAAIRALFPAAAQPAPSELELVEPTADECALEEQIALELGGETAAFDGSRLRAIFKFVKDNPELLKTILVLFGVSV